MTRQLPLTPLLIISLTIAVPAVLLAACGGGGTPPPEQAAPASEPPPPAPPETGETPLPGAEGTAGRPEMSAEECEARGTVVGDPGDGSVHRPEFRCPDGREPIGTVPSGIEGAVCCES